MMSHTVTVLPYLASSKLNEKNNNKNNTVNQSKFLQPPLLLQNIIANTIFWINITNNQSSHYECLDGT